MKRLVEALVETLKAEGNPGLTDEERQFISLIMAGFAGSPTPVRLALLDDFKGIARKAKGLMEEMRERKGPPN